MNKNEINEIYQIDYFVDEKYKIKKVDAKVTLSTK